MIKRGTTVVWHRPPFDTETVKKYRSGVVMRDDGGAPVIHTVHHNAEDFTGHCFGVIRRPGRKNFTALVRLKGHQGMSEVPMVQLSEVKR